MTTARAKKLAARVLSAPHAYAVLELQRGCTPTDVGFARREYARLLHPDRCALPEAASAMASVNVAADALSDERRYHAALRADRRWGVCSACDGAGAVRQRLGGFKGGINVPCGACAGAGLILLKGKT